MHFNNMESQIQMLEVAQYLALKAKSQFCVLGHSGSGLPP
jgi:hypothetical protein